MTHSYVRKLDHHCFKKWLVAYSAPSHYLNHCGNIVNCNPRNFNEILVEIHTFSFTKIHLKMSSGKCGHFVSASMCNALTHLRISRMDVPFLSNTYTFMKVALQSFLELINSIAPSFLWYVIHVLLCSSVTVPKKNITEIPYKSNSVSNCPQTGY